MKSEAEIRAEGKPVFWGILELMGHVRLAGRISEEEMFGSKLGRIDVPTRKTCDCGGIPFATLCPACQGNGNVETFTTQYFAGGSIYRLTPTTEEVARHVADSCRPSPVQPWEFPKAALPAPSREDKEDDFDDEEFDRNG